MQKRVLIADDNGIARRAICRLIASGGFSVCGEAEDGRKAIEQARKLQPDLIVLDFSMPVMNGLQAAKVLKQITPEVPIILYTAHASGILEKEALAAGITSVVSKDQETSDLVTEAGALLGLQRKGTKAFAPRVQASFSQAKPEAAPNDKEHNWAMSSPRMSYHEGDHVCTLFLSPEEQLVAAVEYIREGLARNERSLYVCCDRGPNEFRAALRQAQIAVDAEEARGALILLTKHEGHLQGGTFDPDRMIAMLQKALKDALKAGYTGLRAGGDMSWLLDEAPGSEKLAEYEARLNHFYENNQAIGLCMYNVQRMPPSILDHCLATHKFVRMEGPILLSNPFYEIPEEAVSRAAKPAEVAQKLRHLHSLRPSKSSRLEARHRPSAEAPPTK